MFCPQCGNKASAEARFCSNCGASLPAGTVKTAAGGVSPVAGAANPSFNGRAAPATADTPISSDEIFPTPAATSLPTAVGRVTFDTEQVPTAGKQASLDRESPPVGTPANQTAGLPAGSGTSHGTGFSTAGIFCRTLPYVFLRILVCLLLGLALIVFFGLMAGTGFLIARLFQGAGLPLVMVGLIAVMGAWALNALAQRYFLYLVKIAHVAVITEIVTKGYLPVGTNQVAFGEEKVLRHFGSASALFLVDQLIASTVRQVLNWLTRLAGCLRNIPGLGLVIGVMRRILSLAANYLDEAVMSYILTHEEEDIYQAACDGVVLYAQSWQQLLVPATWCVIFGVGIWAVCFLVMLFPLLGLARALTPEPALQALCGFVVLLVTFVCASMAKWVVVDPIATVAMIISYNRAIAGQVPIYNLRATLVSVSGKFRQLAQKATVP